MLGSCVSQAESTSRTGPKKTDGEGLAQRLTARGQRSKLSRFKSHEHPRVVIKDLDGLEADRVQVSVPSWTLRDKKKAK